MEEQLRSSLAKATSNNPPNKDDDDKTTTAIGGKLEIVIALQHLYGARLVPDSAGNLVVELGTLSPEFTEALKLE